MGDLLPNPLMRSCLVEVGDIRIEHTLELLLLQDQQVIQAFLTNTPEEPLTDGIGSGSVNGGFEQLDATGRRYTSEARPKFGIVVSNQIFRRLSKRRGFSELLRDLGIGWRSGHADMDDLA